MTTAEFEPTIRNLVEGVKDFTTYGRTIVFTIPSRAVDFYLLKRIAEAFGTEDIIIEPTSQSVGYYGCDHYLDFEICNIS